MIRAIPCLGCNAPLLDPPSSDDTATAATAWFCYACCERLTASEREQIAAAVIDPPVGGGHL